MDTAELLGAAVRSALGQHFMRILGEPIDGFTLGPFAMLGFSPGPERDYFTYVTLGLSRSPQPAGGPTPYLELIAHTERPLEIVGNVLLSLALEISQTAAKPFAPFDNWRCQVGMDAHFFLPPAREEEALGECPAPAPDATLQLLEVMPLSEIELYALSRRGPDELCRMLDWPRTPKTRGWNDLRSRLKEKGPVPHGAGPFECLLATSGEQALGGVVRETIRFMHSLFPSSGHSRRSRSRTRQERRVERSVGGLLGLFR
jgi:hypothetical protein